MNLSELTTGLQNAARSFRGGSIPGTTPAPTGDSGTDRGWIAGMSIGSLVVVYFVLRITGLLPRWARII